MGGSSATAVPHDRITSGAIGVWSASHLCHHTQEGCQVRHNTVYP